MIEIKCKYSVQIKCCLYHVKNSQTLPPFLFSISNPFLTLHFQPFLSLFFLIFEPKFLTINSKFLTFLCGTFWRCGNRCFLEDWRNIRMYLRVIGFQQDPPFIRGRSQNLFSKLLHCLLFIKFYHFRKLFSNEENGIKLC